MRAEINDIKYVHIEPRQLDGGRPKVKKFDLAQCSASSDGKFMFFALPLILTTIHPSKQPLIMQRPINANKQPRIIGFLYQHTIIAYGLVLTLNFSVAVKCLFQSCAVWILELVGWYERKLCPCYHQATNVASLGPPIHTHDNVANQLIKYWSRSSGKLGNRGVGQDQKPVDI